MLLLLSGCGGESATGGGGGSCAGVTCLGGGGTGGGGSPGSPTLSVTPGEGENVLTMAPAAGTTAAAFNLYWSTSSQVTIATGTKISGVTSPFTHTGLTNGAPIFYIATAVLGSSQSASSAVAGGMPGKWTALANPCPAPPCDPSSLPPARDSHTAVYDSTSDKMIVFGGESASQALNDFWVLQNATETSATWSGPITTNAPPGRVGHTAVYNDQIHQMTVFGGSLDLDGTSLTSELRGVSNADSNSPQWSASLAGAGPSSRWGHAAVYDSATDRMIVFGGTTQTNGALSKEVWVLDQATTLGPQWRQITTTGGPSVRCCMAAAYDAATRRLILFGGFGFGQTGPTLFGDLWTLTFDATFSTAAWQELTPSGGATLSSRCCAVSLWDGSNLLLFGGGDIGSPSSDDKLYALRLESTTFTAADGPAGGPAARIFPTAVPAGRFLLFGGSGASGPLNDLWRLE